MSDLLKEIKEDIRRERFEKLFKKYGTYIAYIAVLAVGGTAFVTWSNASLEKNREFTGDNYKAAITYINNDDEKAIEMLGVISETGTDGYKELALLRKASVLIFTGEIKKASDVYRKIASDKNRDKAIRDLAILLEIYLVIEHKEAFKDIPVDVTGKLESLIIANSPWKYSAMELRAIYALNESNNEEAVSLFSALNMDYSAPTAMRDRADKMLKILEKG